MSYLSIYFCHMEVIYDMRAIIWILQALILSQNLFRKKKKIPKTVVSCIIVTS